MKAMLTTIKPNTTAKVVGFLAMSNATIRRLGSFGICLDASLCFVRYSLLKQTLLVRVGGHQFALHRSIASAIVVEPLL